MESGFHRERWRSQALRGHRNKTERPRDWTALLVILISITLKILYFDEVIKIPCIRNLLRLSLLLSSVFYSSYEQPASIYRGEAAHITLTSLNLLLYFVHTDHCYQRKNCYHNSKQENATGANRAKTRLSQVEHLFWFYLWLVEKIARLLWLVKTGCVFFANHVKSSELVNLKQTHKQFTIHKHSIPVSWLLFHSRCFHRHLHVLSCCFATSLLNCPPRSSQIRWKAVRFMCA